MKSVKISLQMAQNVKEFVKIVQDYPYEIDLKSDKYCVDAKSILGIFSLAVPFRTDKTKYSRFQTL